MRSKRRHPREPSSGGAEEGSTTTPADAGGRGRARAPRAPRARARPRPPPPPPPPPAFALLLDPPRPPPRPRRPPPRGSRPPEPFGVFFASLSASARPGQPADVVDSRGVRRGRGGAARRTRRRRSDEPRNALDEADASDAGAMIPARGAGRRGAGVGAASIANGDATTRRRPIGEGRRARRCEAGVAGGGGRARDDVVEVPGRVSEVQQYRTPTRRENKHLRPAS